MNYEEWLNAIETLKKGNIDKALLETLQNTEINENINIMLIPKLIELIKTRFSISINKIIKNLSEIFSDINYLDMALVNFKKEINYILELIKLKQIPADEKTELRKEIIAGVNETYRILTEEAINVDSKGTYAQIIEYNKIKWSDNNEL